jgi:hypothetical protein
MECASLASQVNHERRLRARDGVKSFRRREDAVIDQADEQRSPPDEVDVSLIDWYLGLSISERLKAATRAATTLDRLARAASQDR